MMVNLVSENNWDDLFAFYNPTSGARVYITGNTYVGYNSNTGNWIDLNHGASVVTGNIPVGKWTMVTLSVSRSGGARLYVDGKQKQFAATNGSQNGSTISQMSAFKFDEVVDLVSLCDNMFIGYGSFWGSADCYFDDLMVYNRVLTADDVERLYNDEAAGCDITGIDMPVDSRKPTASSTAVFSLSGQLVGHTLEGLPRGIYVRGGKKIVVR